MTAGATDRDRSARPAGPALAAHRARATGATIQHETARAAAPPAVAASSGSMAAIIQAAAQIAAARSDGGGGRQPANHHDQKGDSLSHGLWRKTFGEAFADVNDSVVGARG